MIKSVATIALPAKSRSISASVRLDAMHSIGYGLQGAAAVTPTVSGSTATYRAIVPGTDLTLAATAMGEKESLVLHSASVATSWVFPLRLNGLTPRIESGGSVSFVDGGGSVRATVPPGSMWDSRVDPKSGRRAMSRAVGYELMTVDGGPALRLSVDSVWLSDPARVFPVTVDPTLNLNSSSSTFADSALPGTTPPRRCCVWARRTGRGRRIRSCSSRRSGRRMPGRR